MADGTTKYLVERRVDLELRPDAPPALVDAVRMVRDLVGTGELWTGVGVYDAKTKDAAVELAIASEAKPGEAPKAGVVYRATPQGSVGDAVTANVQTEVKVTLSPVNGDRATPAPRAPRAARKEPVAAS